MTVAALLAGLFSGIIGAMGLGGGAVLIIYLAVFAGVGQLKSQGINLLFFIPIALTAVAVYCFKKQIKWKTVLPIAVFGLIGTVIGWIFAGILGKTVLAKLFGGGLLLLGIKEIYTSAAKMVEKHKKQ